MNCYFVTQTLIGVAAFLLAIGGACAADDGAVIDGPHYSFLIAAPAGWHLTSTKQLQAAFYPEGKTFDKSPVIMYVRCSEKAAMHVKTVEEMNALDLRGIQERNPQAESKKVGTARTHDGTEIPVYSFSGGGYFELVAYAVQPKTITVFVLSSETEEDLHSSEKALQALVGSYTFISENVRTPKRMPAAK